MLATSLNLIPLSQLDGGHLLYAVVGRRLMRFAIPVWLAWWRSGSSSGSGWLVWSVIVLVLRLRHPPVWDEAVPLDRRRKVVALLALVILVLCFMPTPIGVLEIR